MTDRERIEIEVGGDASGLERAAERGEKALGQLEDAAQSLGDTDGGSGLADSLERIADLAGQLDLDIDLEGGDSSYFSELESLLAEISELGPEAAQAVRDLGDTSLDGLRKGLDGYKKSLDDSTKGLQGLSEKTRNAAKAGVEAGERIERAMRGVAEAVEAGVDGVQAAEVAWQELGGSPSEFLAQANSEAEKQVVLLAEISKNINQLEEESGEGFGSFADRAAKAKVRIIELRESLDSMEGGELPGVRKELQRLEAQFKDTFDTGVQRVQRVETELRSVEAAARSSIGGHIDLTDALSTRWPKATTAILGAASAIAIFKESFSTTRAFLDWLKEMGVDADAAAQSFLRLQQAADFLEGANPSLAQRAEYLRNLVNAAREAGDEESLYVAKVKAVTSAIIEQQSVIDKAGTDDVAKAKAIERRDALEDELEALEEGSKAYKEFLDTVGKTAQTLSTQETAFKELAEAILGVDADKAAKDYTRLSDALEHLSEHTDALDDLELSDGILDQLDEIRDALESMPEPMRKAFQTATKISVDAAIAKLDELGSKIDETGRRGSKALRELSEEAAGIDVSNLADQFRDLGDAVRALGESPESASPSVVRELHEQLDGIFEQLDKLPPALVDAFEESSGTSVRDAIRSVDKWRNSFQRVEEQAKRTAEEVAKAMETGAESALDLIELLGGVRGDVDVSPTGGDAGVQRLRDAHADVERLEEQLAGIWDDFDRGPESFVDEDKLNADLQRARNRVRELELQGIDLPIDVGVDGAVDAARQGGEEIGLSLNDALIKSGFVDAVKDLPPEVQNAVTAVVSEFSRLEEEQNALDPGLVELFAERLEAAFGDQVPQSLRSFVDSLRGAQEATRDAVAELEDHARASSVAAGQAADMADQWSNAAGAMGEGTIKVEGSGEVLKNFTEEARAASDAMRETGEAADEAGTRIEGTGESIGIVGDTVEGGAEAFERWTGIARDAADETEEAGTRIEGAGDQISATGDRVGDTADVLEKWKRQAREAADGTEQAGEAAESSADKVDRFKDAAESAVEPVESLGAAGETASQGLGPLADDAESLRGSLEGISVIEGTVDIITGVGEASGTAAEPVATLRDGIEVIAGSLESIKASGGGVEPLGALAEASEGATEPVAGLAKEAGELATSVGDAEASLGAIPGHLETTASAAEEAGPALSELDSTASDLGKTVRETADSAEDLAEGVQDSAEAAGTFADNVGESKEKLDLLVGVLEKADGLLSGLPAKLRAVGSALDDTYTDERIDKASQLRSELEGIADAVERIAQGAPAAASGIDQVVD